MHWIERKFVIIGFVKYLDQAFRFCSMDVMEHGKWKLSKLGFSLPCNKTQKVVNFFFVSNASKCSLSVLWYAESANFPVRKAESVFCGKKWRQIFLNFLKLKRRKPEFKISCYSPLKKGNLCTWDTVGR